MLTNPIKYWHTRFWPCHSREDGDLGKKTYDDKFRKKQNTRGSLMIEFTALVTVLVFLLALVYETERYIKIQFFLRNATYRLAMRASLDPSISNCTNIFTQLNKDGAFMFMEAKGTFFVTGLTTGNVANNTILWSRQSTTTNPSHVSSVTATMPALSNTTTGYAGPINTVVVETVYDSTGLFSYFSSGQQRYMVAIDYRGSVTFPVS